MFTAFGRVRSTSKVTRLIHLISGSNPSSKTAVVFVTFMLHAAIDYHLGLLAPRAVNTVVSPNATNHSLCISTLSSDIRLQSKYRYKNFLNLISPNVVAYSYGSMALVASRNEAVLDVDWTIFDRIHHLVYELHDWLISTTNSFPAQVVRNAACYGHSQ